MDIIIPTYGRANKQITAERLLRAGLTPTLVVQSRESHLYRDFPNVVVLPAHITTIAPTRQKILDTTKSSKIVMLDDDLVFFTRRSDDPTKLQDIDDDGLRAMLGGVEANLNDYTHVGIAAREGANRNTEHFVENTRIMRVLGYDASILRKYNIRFDRLSVMEDFDVALQLLENGLPNLVLNHYANNQSGSGSAGGCSHFRTPEVQRTSAEKLAELHPQFVTVVQKETKTAWGGGTRYDVRIQWKRAYEYGLSRRRNGTLDSVA